MNQHVENDMAEVQSAPSTPVVNLWVGSSLGILKGVSVSARVCTNVLPGNMTLSEADKSREICAMCWEHQSKDQLYVGLRNGLVQCFDCARQVFTAQCECTDGEECFVGLGKHENTLITCTDRGSLCYWPQQEHKVECCVGRQTSVMHASPGEMLQVATGGRENCLKVWDGRNTTAPVFQAKNVRNDSLDLRVPVWVSSLAFVPNTGAQPTLVEGIAHHQVRLYDTRAQRRPVYSRDYGEARITALCVSGDGRYFFAGTSVGTMARFDLRKGGIVNHYKGFAGGVSSVVCHQGEGEGGGAGSLVATCGQDRYVRVFQSSPSKLLHKVYVKLQCNCLLFASAEQTGGPHTRGGAAGVKRSHSDVHSQDGGGGGGGGGEESDGDGGGGDDVWDSMETVGEVETRTTQPALVTKRKKRSKKVTCTSNS